MKKLMILFMITFMIFALCCCSDNDIGEIDNSISSITSESNSTDNKLTMVSSDKGYAIGVNTDLFEYKLGDNDTFSAKNGTAFLEVNLSGGKTVDTTLDEISSKLSGEQYALSKSESIAVGREFYTARYFTAEKEGKGREYYLIPVQNECLILVFEFGDDNTANETLSSMLDTLMID